MDLTLSMLVGAIPGAKYRPFDFIQGLTEHSGYLINYPAISDAWIIIAAPKEPDKYGRRAVSVIRYFNLKKNIFTFNAGVGKFAKVGDLTIDTMETITDNIKSAYIECLYSLEVCFRIDIDYVDDENKDKLHVVYRESERQIVPADELLRLKAVSVDHIFRQLMVETLGCITVNPINMSKLAQ